MHHAQIEERATFLVFHNFVTVSNRSGWNNLRVLWSLHPRFPNQVAELHRTQAHPTKVWWNVYSYYRTWLLIFKVYCKYILYIENIVKASRVTFFLQPGMTSSSTSYYYKKPVSQYCSYKSIFRPFIKICGQLCKMLIFVKFAIIFSRLKKCPCKTYSHLLYLRFASNTQFMDIYKLMMTE